MEKKSNMQNADELCIEYVLNELDPSEAVMVERAMENDMNLLIEIECFRRTLKRLDELPYQRPPANVRELVIHQAINHYHQNRRSLAPRWRNTTVMATAAAVVLSAMISLFNLYPDSVLPGAGETAEGSSAIEAEVNVNPWVDRNNVLHINQTGTEFTSTEGRDGQNNLQRLRPIQEAPVLNPALRDIHLTRSTQN